MKDKLTVPNLLTVIALELAVLLFFVLVAFVEAP
jgi:hypothetical protein